MVGQNKDLEDQRSIVPDIRTVVMDRLRVIPCIGIIMALLSSIFFATASFTVELTPGVDAAFIVSFRSVLRVDLGCHLYSFFNFSLNRSVFQVIFFLPLSIYFKEPLHGIDGERMALLQRSITGYVTFAMSYYALSYISLSDSSAISFSAPVFVAVIAYFALKEPCGLFQVITVIGTVIGVFLIARPSFLFETDVADTFTVSERITGTIMSVVCCLSMAYTYVTMRKLVKTPTNAIIVIFSFFSIFLGCVNMNISSFVTGKVVGLPKSSFEWGMIVINGICGVLNQVALVLSLKFEEAGLVSLLRTFDIVIAFAYQAAFLNQPIYWTSILGSVIVCSGCVAVALKKYLASKQHSNELSD